MRPPWSSFVEVFRMEWATSGVHTTELVSEPMEPISSLVFHDHVCIT